MKNASLSRRTALAISFSLLLLPPCLGGGVETVEIGNVQFTKFLGGVVADATGAPLADVQVVEVTPDWHATIRITKTNADGRWSLLPRPKGGIYFLRFITKQCCFNEVRCRVELRKRTGKELRITLPVST